MTSSQIADYFKKELNLDMTPSKIGRLLKREGYLFARKRIDGSPIKGWLVLPTTLVLGKTN